MSFVSKRITCLLNYWIQSWSLLWSFFWHDRSLLVQLLLWLSWSECLLLHTSIHIDISDINGQYLLAALSSRNHRYKSSWAAEWKTFNSCVVKSSILYLTSMSLSGYIVEVDALKCFLRTAWFCSTLWLTLSSLVGKSFIKSS